MEQWALTLATQVRADSFGARGMRFAPNARGMRDCGGECESPEPVRFSEARESVRVSLALKFADVAQLVWYPPFPLVRALAFQASCHEFESRHPLPIAMHVARSSA